MAPNEIPRRVVLVSYGSAGDLYPLCGLALAYRSMGREVLLLATPAHADALARSGVPWQPLGDGENYRRALADPELWHPRRGIRVLLREFGDQMAQLRETLRALLPADQAALVLCHPFGLPALDLLRRERPRLRVAGTHLAPASLRSVRDPMVWGPYRLPGWIGPAFRRRLWRFADRHMVDPWGLPALNALRGAHGLAPVPHFLPHLAEAADFVVTLFPPWFGATQPDWRGPVVEGGFVMFDPFAAGAGEDPAAALPPALQDFLAAGDAPLVFTPGSANAHAARLFAASLRAVQALGRRAVFLTPHRAQVPAQLPPQVLWLPYVPLAALLPKAALLLHHGGVGTAAQALRAGVPQMVVPHGWDQFDNACRLRDLGVARSRPVWSLFARGLRRDLQALLSDAAVRRACEAAAARLAAEAPAHAGRWVELGRRIDRQAFGAAAN